MMETPEKAAPMTPATGWLGSSPGRQWRLLLRLWFRYFSFSWGKLSFTFLFWDYQIRITGLDSAGSVVKSFYYLFQWKLVYYRTKRKSFQRECHQHYIKSNKPEKMGKNKKQILTNQVRKKRKLLSKEYDGEKVESFMCCSSRSKIVRTLFCKNSIISNLTEIVKCCGKCHYMGPRLPSPTN